jgi:exosortase/archaeosortase family protein
LNGELLVRGAGLKDTIESRRTGVFDNDFTRFLIVLGILQAVIMIVLMASSVFLTKLYVDLMERIYKSLGLLALRTAWNGLLIKGFRIVTIIITNECLGIYSVLLFITLILVTPRVRVHDRFKALLIYTPVLLLANLARIIVSGVVGAIFGYQAFRFVHDAIGSFLMLLLVAFLWIEWLYTIHHRTPFKIQSKTSPSSR